MGKCNTCVDRWEHGSVQPCRDCKYAKFGGTKDNYTKDKDENIEKIMKK